MKDFKNWMQDYDFYFDQPMKSGMQSIPLGNGEMGANVWVDESGIVKILLSRTDAWSEIYRLLKVGLLELKVTPNPFEKEVHAHFSLYDAALYITAPGVTVRIFADANAPAIRLAVQVDKKSSEQEFPGEEFSAELVSVNYRTREFAPGSDFSNYHMQGAAIYGANGHTAPVSYAEGADVSFEESGIFGRYHYNEHSCYQYTMEHQHLAEFAGEMEDPFLHRIFGYGVLDEKNTGSELVYTASIFTATLTSSTPDEWKQHIMQLAEQYGTEKEDTFENHKSSWHEKWAKSYVLCPKDSEGFLFAKGFLYQRYMNLCAGKGAYPIKFNGSIFTADEMEGYPGNYDARRWGAPYWIQNTRLIYWGMLESGDYDLMKPFFKMYLDVMPICKGRVRKYYNHRGMLLPETMTCFGTSTNRDYGFIQENGVRAAYGVECHLPGDNPCRYIRWHYNGMVEIAYLMLRYVEKTGDREQMPDFLAFTKEVLLFFRDHFEVYDGKLLMTPVSSLETWQYCVNDTPDIAGIMAVNAAVRACGAADEELMALCEEMDRLLPELPMDETDGKKVIAPCEQKIDKKMRNVENPELYPIFPYYLYGLDKPDLQLAIDTYHARIKRLGKGWSQDPVQAALLGLTEEAAEHLKQRIPAVDERAVFPAFWGPNFDETPDQDHGNNILLCVAAMLYQEGRMLPAWPKDWDVSFRLPDGKGGFVAVDYENGEVK